MFCPKCKSSNHFVVDSRSVAKDGSIRRRRECENKACGHRFTTYEKIENLEEEKTFIFTIKKGAKTHRYSAKEI